MVYFKYAKNKYVQHMVGVLVAVGEVFSLPPLAIL